MEWRHYLLGAPFQVLSDHESLKWLRTQNASTLSDRLLRWVEYFSLFDFQHDFIPGENNVIPDTLSRPATQVLLLSREGEAWDLATLAVRFDKHQTIVPQAPTLCTIIEETKVHNEFLAEIRKAQTNDQELQRIKTSLLQPGPPPAERMLYQVEDELVVVPEPDGRRRLVVPSGSAVLQLSICRYFHDEAGHQGVHHTLNAIAIYFYWPNMQRMVRSYVTSCTVCQAAKSGNRNPPGRAEPHALPNEPGAHWSLDFLELPTSNNGHTCLLVFTDRVSKVVILAPMKSTTAIEVAQAFVEHVFCWFGMPQSFLSDRGPQFRSAVFHEICNMLGSSVKHSTPHTPHSHGDVERQNRIINDILRTLSQSQYPDLLATWDQYAKIIQFALNTAVVERHGMTPLFFFFGRHPRIPASVNLPFSALDPLSLEFVEAFQTRLQQALDLGREGQVRMVAAMDQGRDTRYQYNVGDWAFLASTETPVPGENHFQCKWTGPFPILATTTSTVTLELPEHWQLLSNTFHVDKVKPYVPRAGAEPPPARPRQFKRRPPDNLGTIARISQHRRTGRILKDGRRANLQYFVHWQGLPIAYGEWLDLRQLQQLAHSDRHIQSYCRIHNVSNP